MSNSTVMHISLLTIQSDLISDQAIEIIFVVNYCAIMGIISVIGTISNIVNIIIFIKLGFKDTTNISLLGIAVADAGALLTLIWGSIAMNPLMIQKLDNLVMLEINYLTSAWPHVYFVRVTGCLTSLVTIERYLCIAYPFQVKNLITPQRISIINIIAFLIMTADIIPVFTSSSIQPKFSFIKNTTVFGIVYTSNSKTVQDILSYFNNISELGSFFCVSVLTIALVHTLNKNAKWRNLTLTTSNARKISIRDQRTVLMIIFISILFIICYFPTVVIFVVMKFVQELTISGLYQNLFSAIGIFTFMLEAINSAANIFVYLRMSSKYREVFLSLLTRTYAQPSTSTKG